MAWDSLVSVGSFPELVSSDPPRKVEKAHGVLEVEVWNCRVLDKREETSTGSEHAQAGRHLSSLNANPFF